MRNEPGEQVPQDTAVRPAEGKKKPFEASIPGGSCRSLGVLNPQHEVVTVTATSNRQRKAPTSLKTPPAEQRSWARSVPGPWDRHGVARVRGLLVKNASGGGVQRTRMIISADMAHHCLRRRLTKFAGGKGRAGPHAGMHELCDEGLSACGMASHASLSE